MSVDETADRLYALPSDQFTKARNHAERELRKAGDRERADRVKALRKPSAAAAAQGDALEKLVSLGGESVRATLQAAAVDDNTARDVLVARLVHEPEPAGFGTLLTHSDPEAAKSSRNCRTQEPARSRPRTHS